MGAVLRRGGVRWRDHPVPGQVGLVVTASLGLLMFGALNPISVAFAVLFLGLGADFAIQFTVRYRAQRHVTGDLYAGLLEAADRVGAPLTLAAGAAAAGFLSFWPTPYAGLAQLGVIAGAGMGVAYAASLTLLPALLSAFDPPGEPESLRKGGPRRPDCGGDVIAASDGATAQRTLLLPVLHAVHARLAASEAALQSADPPHPYVSWGFAPSSPSLPSSRTWKHIGRRHTPWKDSQDIDHRPFEVTAGSGPPVPAAAAEGGG